MINDVLDLAKADAGKLELRPRPFAVAEVVGEVVSILRGSAAARRLRVSSDVDAALGTVVLDPDRFRQILYNYLSNALKFAPEGSEVRVRARGEGEDQLRVEVEDAGPGIAPADVGRLFVDFQQLESGLGRRHAGTGVGLALTRRIVEAQGGSVGVRSTPGEGSVFHAVLPRRAVASDVRMTRRTLGPRFDARKVLVIDDDARDAAALVGALAEAGHAVELVSTGADALARCRDGGFDAIALDLLLPDMSGLDVLAGLRALGTQQDAALIVISAADPSLVDARSVTAVMTRPIDPRAVIAALQRAWADR